MHFWRPLTRGLRALFRQHDADQDVADELAHFVDQSAQAHVARGLSPAAALDAARRDVGNLTAAGQDVRESGWENIVRGALLKTNLKGALRGFVRAPAFTLSALLTLAICLGANLAVFAVVDAVLLRPLPFPESDRLVAVYNTYPNAGVDRDGSSVTNYYERRGGIPAFAAASLYRPSAAIVGETGATERVDVLQVTSDFFGTLGVAPRLGRPFTEGEMDVGRGDVAILTDGYWREHFAGDTAVIGRRVRINGVPRTVVGVLPPSFRFLSSPATVVLPLVSSVAQRMPAERHSGSNAEMVARLAPGWTIAGAQRAVDAHNAIVEKSDPQAKMMVDAGFRSVVASLHGDHIASVRPMLILLQAGVLLLVLMGGVTLANLFSVRAGARAKELVIRQAIGAGSGHIMGQVISETLLLTLGGGVLGIAVGAAGVRLVRELGVNALPLGATIGFSLRAAIMTLAIACVAGVSIAVPIAWSHLRSRPAESLGAESRGSTGGRASQRLRNGFTVAQVSLAFMLLAGSLVLGASLERAMRVSPGFRAAQVLTGRLNLPHATYPDVAALSAFADRLDDALAAEPGVVAAGLITNIPLSGTTIKSALTVRGYTLRPGESLHGYYTYGVAGRYFAALGVPLRAGRLLEARDAHAEARVCVVDEDFAKRFWPGGSAIGHQVYQGGDDGHPELAYTIVGVVGSVKQADVTEAPGQGAAYFPFVRRADSDVFVVVRTARRPEAFATTLARVTRQLDPDLPVASMRSMSDRVAGSLVARRSPALLAAMFASVAVLLAAIGTYGVLSYAVSQRRREIAVRLALGAQPREVSRQFLAGGMRLLGLGLGLGVAGTWATAGFMRRIVFGIAAFDLPMVVVAASIIAVVSLAACVVPARRASKTDPMVALTSE